MNIAVRYRDRADSSVLLPRVNWRNAMNDRRIAKTAERSMVTQI